MGCDGCVAIGVVGVDCLLVVLDLGFALADMYAHRGDNTRSVRFVGVTGFRTSVMCSSPCFSS